jgi:hypothetical protein
MIFSPTAQQNLADYMGSMFETSLFFIEMAGQAHGIVS